jgi:hypothetical protein
MAALFVAAVATSCGSTSGVGGAPNGGPDTTISTGPSTAGLEISGVAPGADPTVLVATAEAVPVGPGSCAVEVTPLVEYEADRIYLSLTVTVEMTQVLEIVDGGGFRTIEESTSTDGCDLATTPVQVTLDGPLDRRAVITQNPTANWQAGADGSYQRCELPACDPETGQVPPAAGCGDSTLPDAVRRGDVPRRAGIDVRACELPWAVVDIDIGAGACPATGEPGNPCAGTNIDRSYWKVVDGTWDVLAYSSGAGCGDVLDALPELPRQLCADLPPVP